MILAAMLDAKETMAGLTTVIAGLADCRSDQGPSGPMTTCAGGMLFQVGGINRHAGSNAAGSDMAG